MHIGFLACFHAISLERSRFSEIATFFLALVALKLLASLISCLVACSARIVADKQTHIVANWWRKKVGTNYSPIILPIP